MCKSGGFAEFLSQPKFHFVAHHEKIEHAEECSRYNPYNKYPVFLIHRSPQKLSMAVPSTRPNVQTMAKVMNPIGLNPRTSHRMSLGKPGIAKMANERMVPRRSVKKQKRSSTSSDTAKLTIGNPMNLAARKLIKDPMVNPAVE